MNAATHSDFCLRVIKEGYKLQLKDCSEDVKYEEKSNKSYREYREFANEAVDKLVAIGVVKRVNSSKFVSPLTVAVNKVGKKRLCIDLSRGLNKYAVSRKFKIRSLKEIGNWSHRRK